MTNAVYILKFVKHNTVNRDEKRGILYVYSIQETNRKGIRHLYRNEAKDMDVAVSK